MVDDQDRRVDSGLIRAGSLPSRSIALRIAAKIGDGGDAGEILHQDARRAVGDFAVAAADL